MDSDDQPIVSKSMQFIVYIADGDTFADVKKLHVWDEWIWCFTTGGEYYIDSSIAADRIWWFGYYKWVCIFRNDYIYVSDDSAAVRTLLFRCCSVFWGAVLSKDQTPRHRAQLALLLGSYAVTFTLKGHLASSDITDSLQIQAVAGGSQVVDFNGNPVPFAYNSGTLSYIADSNDPFTTFQQLVTDASKLAYSAGNASTNGGFYLAGSTDGTQLEVAFDSAPGSSDYIGISQGGSVVMPVPAASAAPGPDADTAEVTPGKFLAGQVEIVDATDGVISLGDLEDFNAGLSS